MIDIEVEEVEEVVEVALTVPEGLRESVFDTVRVGEREVVTEPVTVAEDIAELEEDFVGPPIDADTVCDTVTEVERLGVLDEEPLIVFVGETLVDPESVFERRVVGDMDDDKDEVSDPLEHADEVDERVKVAVAGDVPEDVGEVVTVDD